MDALKLFVNSLYMLYDWSLGNIISLSGRES
jgi:hypothetical protein